ncbi:MAG: glycosyl hydrolase family 18 protein [Chloroflexota bacterium]|nr:glycosyl hydrolase family 18 protein [Chloroflexota bacterium]
MSLPNRRIAVPFTSLLLMVAGLAAFAVVSTSTTMSAASAPPKPAEFPVRWGFYVTYNPNSLVSLQANIKSLNYVSPWFYYLNAAGQVTGDAQSQVNTLLRRNGVKSLPMIKNTPQYNDFTSVLSDTTKQLSVIDQIDNLVSANSYDGITIDFEGLNPADGPLLTQFMDQLYARLHPEGKLVAMAVGAKVKDIDSGWSAPYDYTLLGHSVDFFLVMGYDYHWSTSDPGPVAPIDRLALSASYTVAHVPASKVVWGVGVYGYDWPTDGAGTATGKADYRSYAEAQALTGQPDAQSGYDVVYQAPWVRYISNNQPREVWYENGHSFGAKLDLVQRNHMAGFALWRLGQEDPAIWGIMSGPRTPVPLVTGTPHNTYLPLPSRTSTSVRSTATRTPMRLPQFTPTPTARPTPPVACLAVQPFTSSSDKVYFSATGHALGGIFLRYWQTYGGLPVFGFPLTEAYTETSPTDGKPYRVQYFERNRFEYHPENVPPNDVQLGLLGVQAMGNSTFAAARDFNTGTDIVYFPQVQHTISGPFLKYWQRYGGIGQFGYPISEPVLERDPKNGQTYTVQYLERARMEWHTEYSGTDAEVLLGLLGRDVMPCR